MRGISGQMSGNERNNDLSVMDMPDDEDDEMLLGFSAGALYKRADFLDKEEAAKSHPKRTYYFRKPEAADLDKLVQLSTKQLNARPDNAKALHIRAMSLMKLGAFEAAAEDYSAMLRLDSRDVATLYNRGCAREKMGNFQAAIKDFTEVLARDPLFAAAAYARGACQNQIGNFDDAINDYNMALSRDQGLPSSPSNSSISKVGLPDRSRSTSPVRHADRARQMRASGLRATRDAGRLKTEGLHQAFAREMSCEQRDAAMQQRGTADKEAQVLKFDRQIELVLKY
jgi:tetratricopeptide (TPR) repeat protein